MIAFNRPFTTGNELGYITDACNLGHLSGDGKYSKLCQEWLENNLETKKALLTNSCTSALEMAAILADIQPGDEIIMPSYTFVSSANAFVLRGGVPVFIDIRADTLNIDENLIEQAITSRTKAIVPVHYAGVPCEMDKIMDIAGRHNLIVIEDAAQAILSSYKGRPLGSIGHMGCLSFHETKNIQSGEGGALLINDETLIERAEIIREKGTDRSKFFRGQVDKYTWRDLGSSFLPSEITAAFLWSQLQQAREILDQRMKVWLTYSTNLADCSRYLTLPSLENRGNAHMFQILCASPTTREDLRASLKTLGIAAVSHYIPLHSSPAGLQFGKVKSTMDVTDRVSSTLLRLPLYPDLGSGLERVIDCIKGFYRD